MPRAQMGADKEDAAQPWSLLVDTEAEVAAGRVPVLAVGAFLITSPTCATRWKSLVAP